MVLLFVGAIVSIARDFSFADNKGAGDRDGRPYIKSVQTELVNVF